MCLIISFVPATLWIVVGYFVLYSSSRSQAGIQAFGRILAVWVFILAALFPFMGAYFTLFGNCPLEAMFQGMPTG